MDLFEPDEAEPKRPCSWSLVVDMCKWVAGPRRGVTPPSAKPAIFTRSCPGHPSNRPPQKRDRDWDGTVPLARLRIAPAAPVSGDLN